MPSPTWKNRNIFEDALNLENPLTDALRNFLKYRPVRDALWRTLRESIQESVDFSSIEDIQTHYPGGHSEGIPDLVLYGPNFILVIEVKIGAKLTDKHQKKAYVPWIEKEIEKSQKEMGFVVFLIPDYYSHRAELDSCLKKAGSSKNPNIQVLDSPITWEQLVKELGSQNMQSLNELTLEFYNYLSERFKSVIFSTEEVDLMNNKKTASVIIKLIDIVDKVKDKSNSLSSGRLDSSGHGYNFSSSNKKKSIWFGIWWEYWEEEGFPLCIAILKEYHSPQMLNAFKKRSEKFVDFKDCKNREWLVAEYNLPESDKKSPEPNTDCSKLINDIATDIENLLQ